MLLLARKKTERLKLLLPITEYLRSIPLSCPLHSLPAKLRSDKTSTVGKTTYRKISFLVFRSLFL